MTMQRLRTIFASFFKIGLFTFGGGYAMLPLIEQELIAKRGWIEHKEFLDLLTLAQSVPGPIAINTSVFVGYKMRGLKGAVAALLGSVLPSFVIILAIAAAAFAVWYLGWSPIYILIAAAAIGISWTLLITKKAKK